MISSTRRIISAASVALDSTCRIRQQSHGHASTSAQGEAGDAVSHKCATEAWQPQNSHTQVCGQGLHTTPPTWLLTRNASKMPSSPMSPAHPLTTSTPCRVAGSAACAARRLDTISALHTAHSRVGQGGECQARSQHAWYTHGGVRECDG